MRKVEIIEKENAYQGFYTLQKIKLKHEFFEGQMSDEMIRELVVRPDAVCVLALDLTINKILLLEQFRIGSYNKTQNPWLLEIIAGLIEENESIEEVAKREAFEEAGITVNNLIKIMEYFPSPGGTDEKIHLFLAICDLSEVKTGIFGLKSENEDIRTSLLDIELAKQMLVKAEFNNAATIIALQYLTINEDNLREKYGKETTESK